MKENTNKFQTTHSFFDGKAAEFYDLFYADKPYDEEVKFVDRCLSKFSNSKPQRLLELACGTGSHSLRFAQQGYRVVAIDLSGDMLNVAKNKSAQVLQNIDFRQANIADLRHEDIGFDAVVLLTDGIGYCPDNQAVIECLINIRDRLITGGFLVLEFLHAPSVIKNYEPVRTKRIYDADMEIVRTAESSLDVISQTINVRQSISESSHKEHPVSILGTQTVRYFSMQEMLLFLSSAGLKPLEWFAGFDEKAKITEDTWHVVCISQKI